MTGGRSLLKRSVRWRIAVAYSVVVFALTLVVMAAAMLTATNPAVAALVTLVAMLPLTLAIGWFISDRAFRPADDLAVAAREIGRGDDLTARIRPVGPDDEWRRLTVSIDGMLDGIETGVEERWAFVQDLSHELRNPLAVMATTLDVALGDEDASIDELRRSAEVVRRSVDRVARTVDDLIVFARNETPEAKRTGFDLAVVLSDVLAEHEGPIGAQRLAVEIHGRPVFVTADRAAIKRAVSNIVGNAVRLSRPASVLRAGTGLHAGFGWVGVDDQGPGIEPSQHDHVFRRFWSHDAASLGGEERSGLGLAITRQIAEQHGGLVTLRSELGPGAEFVIWIPTSPQADAGQISADGIHPMWSPLQDNAATPSAGEAKDEATGSFISA
jgi:signal transduction histidine kinase